MLTSAAWAQNVAKIGETEYATLADAIAAVPTDGTETTITMLADVDLTAALTIANTKNVFLDLNGKTIKNDASKSLAQLIIVNGKLTINDSSEPSTGVIQNTASAKYVIKTSTAVSVLTLNSGTIQTTTGNSNGAVYGTSGSFVMTGGSIIAAGTGVTSKNVNISGGSITATAGQALCAAGTISGGTFTSTNNNAVYANQSGTLEITGGTFTGVSSKPTINIYTADVKVTDATLNNGVGFISNATAMLLSGTDAAYLSNTHAGFYDEETLVGYAPINTGLLASSKVSGKTVKLTKDVATTTYINVTKSFTLDLNGHNITCTPAKADAAILTKGTASAPVVLTITGEGKVYCGDHGEGCNAIQVGNYSTINIEGGEFEVPGDNSTIYMLAIAGSSVVNISGGTFKSGDGKYVLNVKDDVCTYNTYNVTGGTFVGFDPADNIAEGAHTNFVNEDYKSVNNGDGTFSVVEREYVAQIDEKKYEALDDAINAANEAGKGVTITLLADVTATVEPASSVTIDANSHILTLPTFTVVDGAPLAYAKVINATGDTYKVSTATYTRTMPTGTKWGTVCVPFTLKQGDGTSALKLYTFGEISESTLTVTEVAADATVEPGTPVVFSSSVSAAVFSTADAAVSKAAPATTGALIGTYEKQTLESNLSSIYYINGDKFHQAKVSLTVPAYRAYIKTSASFSASSSLSIEIEGAETAIESILSSNTAAASISDINGRLLSTPQKGVNIIKLSNGKTIKLIVE